MALFQRKTPLEKEWIRLQKREKNFLRDRMNKKEGTLDAMLAGKVPDRLQETLSHAFRKTFALIFEKGTGIIEKTYRKDRLEKENAADRDTVRNLQTKKTLRASAKKAVRTGRGNMLLSGAAGIGMGVIGVGLPDIPLFTAQLLRNLYEIALRYGYGYESAREKSFILLLIRGGLSHGDELLAINAHIDRVIGNAAGKNRVEEEIGYAADALSRELLYMKFLQGIPIVGAVGGAYDLLCMKRINEYANLKYQRRYLLEHGAADQ